MTVFNTIHYKSFADLSNDIQNSLYKIPRDVSLIVGVPRSGMLAASIMALSLNIRFCEVNSFLRNDPLKNGTSRVSNSADFIYPNDAKHILVLDDSIFSGRAMIEVRSKIEKSGFKGQVSYMAIYAIMEAVKYIDIHAEILPHPRFFQWNLFHRYEVAKCCFDIDGVLCKDPSSEQNDDGANYSAFILGAASLMIPSYKVGHLVTSRLEKYRPQTEKWLADHGIQYGQLHMLGLATAEERRKAGVHGSFKAEVYKSLDDTILFIESEAHQAEEICKLSGKPVLDFGNQRIINPGITARNVARYIYHGYKKNSLFEIPFKIIRKIKRLVIKL